MNLTYLLTPSNNPTPSNQANGLSRSLNDGDNAIEASELTVNYHDKQILNSLDFTIPSGSRVAIIGPNGAGKSTLLSALMGLMPINYKRLQIKHRQFATLNRRALSQYIAYIPQYQTIDPNMSVDLWCEMARFPHQRWGFSLTKREIELIDWALKKTDTLAFRGRQLNQLSGGERQRIYIASALIQETPLIFLDEPNNFLDPKYLNAMHALIIELATELDKTLLYVTHDLNQITQIEGGFTHVMALKAGEIAFFGRVDEVFSLASISDLYEYTFQIAHTSDGREVYF